MQAQEMFIGVDVAKATLSSCIDGLPGRLDLSNDEVSIGVWLATLPSQAAIAVESTGRYHLKLVRMAHASGRRVFVLNARDVYFSTPRRWVRGARQTVPMRRSSRATWPSITTRSGHGLRARLRRSGCKSCCGAVPA